MRAKRLEGRARSEEVRGKREEDSALSTPRSRLLALASPLLAFFLFALPSSLFALPGEYQELKDGLPFNGKQWIATGYCPTASDRFECDVTVADAQSNATAAVFGTVREGEPERTFAFYVRQDGDDSSVVAYGDTARGGLFPRVKDKEVVSLSVDPGGATWTWPGGSDRLALMPGFARDGVTPLMIGDANGSSLVDDSFPAGMGTVMKLHRFRIWRGGLELVHDYVPCLDAVSGLEGVFDLCETAGKTPFRGLNMLSDIPYRAWDRTHALTVDCVCPNAFLVLPDTTVLKGGQWHFVKDVVSHDSIKVDDAVPLILGVGAKMTSSAISGGALTVYGQPGGHGEMKVSDTDLKVLTVEGGFLSVRNLSVRSLSVVGGTMKVDSVNAVGVTIDGGSVMAPGETVMATNSAGHKVYCVTVVWEEGSEEGRGESEEGRGLRLEGLGGYGTNDIFAIDGKVYLWLPDGTHRFELSDGQTTFRYCAVVKGRGITVRPLPTIASIGFFVNGEDVGLRAGDGWTYGTNKVLTLDGKAPFVLSGKATNDEVQITATTVGTTVVLSNAFVLASGRPALKVEKGMSLLMAGDESRLGATNTFTSSSWVSNATAAVSEVTNATAAVSVASNAVLTVDLAAGGGRWDAKIGVFNYGDTNAVCGTGKVAVNGGTFFVQADKQAVGTSVEFTFGEAEVMMTGDKPAKLKPAKEYKSEPCVLVAPGVAVSLKEIPHVTGFTVSNAVETIANVTGSATCYVMPGDDVFVGYAVESGWFSQSANPLVYKSVESDVTVDASTILILSNITYRAWNGMQMVDCVCSNYTVVAADTATFGDGRWYAVTGAVSVADLKVDGAAHLILCDGATLTAGEIANGALAVYGQEGGRGILKVSGALDSALTIVGGNMKVGHVEKRPKNAMGQEVFCVTCEKSGELGAWSVEGLGRFGIEKVCPIDGEVCLWLPDGAHLFSLSDGTTTNRYCAVVNGEDITAERLGHVGFIVNGTDVGDAGVGDGWVYFGKVLLLTNAMTYVLSGVATNGEVQVKATDAAKVVMSNMAVFASKPPALEVAQSNLAVATDQVMKTGNAPEELRYAQAYRGEKCVLVAPGVPVTPGALPRGNYATAEAATNALVGAYVVPTNRVAAVLTTETLLRTYCDMFDIDVTGGGSSWSLEAVLTPEAWTNLYATVVNATRQIPVGAIARMSKVSPIAQLPEEVVTTNVTVRGCAPGFFYSLYDGWALTNVVVDANATNLNVLCGADAKVTFPEVKRPSEKTGFFRVGVGVTDNVGKR